MAEEYQLDLNKGVILAGPVGCGKTSLFRLFHLFSRNEVLKCKFKTHTCREVSFEYAISGIQTILDYSKGSFSAYDKTKPLTKLFDDLGTERSIKHFGTEMNIMTEILISRYEYFISHNMRTYITTNLGAKEIGEIYGERVQSRLREMCNFITFGGEMVDKRK